MLRSVCVVGSGAGSPRACGAALIVLSALCGAAAARAQDEGVEARARQHFETGALLYQEENYDGALAAFEESYRLRPVPVVLFNIAQTLRRLDRYAEAIESYERYLREEPDLSAERRGAVRSTIAELRRAVAPVRIEADVDGVTIEVDGRVVGTTPLPAPLDLAAGQRDVVARRDGYITVREQVRVVGGEPQRVMLRMAPAVTAGTLTVRSNVARATVRIDGLDVGIAPAHRQLAQGGHSVEVEAEGYDTFQQEVVIAARQHRELLADLEPAHALYEQWWLWAVAGAVLVGAVVAGVAVAAGSGQGDPVPGTLGTVAALR